MRLVTHLDCAKCRECGGGTQIIEKQIVTLKGVRTTLRTHRCRICYDSYQTAEMPLEVAKDVWESEA